MGVDDRPILVDKDRLADAQLFSMLVRIRVNCAGSAAHSTLRTAQLIDRHIGHGQLRHQVVAPLRGVVGDCDDRALTPAAGLATLLSERACGSRAQRQLGYFSVGMMSSSSGLRNLLSEREEATTQPRDGIQASTQSIRPRGPRSHIFERPDISTLLVLELPARSDDRSPTGSGGQYKGGRMHKRRGMVNADFSVAMTVVLTRTQQEVEDRALPLRGLWAAAAGQTRPGRRRPGFPAIPCTDR